jgi:hypothetical protein
MKKYAIILASLMVSSGLVAMRGNQVDLISPIQYSNGISPKMSDYIEDQRAYVNNMQNLKDLAKNEEKEVINDHIILTTSHIVKNVLLHDEYTKKEWLTIEDRLTIISMLEIQAQSKCMELLAELANKEQQRKHLREHIAVDNIYCKKG